MKHVAQDPRGFPSSFDSAFARLQVNIETACAAETDWPTKVAAGIRAMLDFAVADPVAARTLTTDALAAGRQGLIRYERMIAYFSELFLPGRALRPEGERLPEIIGRAMTGGVATLVARRLDEGLESELPALAPEAIQFVLTPYLGAEWARRVAAETQ
jgi:hypothetical protein